MFQVKKHHPEEQSKALNSIFHLQCAHFSTFIHSQVFPSKVATKTHLIFTTQRCIMDVKPLINTVSQYQHAFSKCIFKKSNTCCIFLLLTFRPIPGTPGPEFKPKFVLSNSQHMRSAHLELMNRLTNKKSKGPKSIARSQVYVYTQRHHC